MATKRTAKKTSAKSTAAKNTPTKSTTISSATKSVATKKSPAKRSSTRTSAKSTPKTTVKSTAATKTESSEYTKPTPTTTNATNAQTRGSKSYIILIVVIVLLGAALYYFRGLFVAAVVNGQPISRLEVVRQTEQQSGKQTLETLEQNALIEQEAKKENVTVSDKEVNDEIAKLQTSLKAQGQTMDQVLAAQGMSQDDLRKLIRIDDLVKKMVGKNIKVSDQEVNDYISKNKDSLPATDDATLKKQVKAQLVQQKTNDAVRTWLANLKSKATIIPFVSY